MQSFETLPMSIRIGNAFISYIAYIGKMIWPNNLAVFYPYPGLLVPWQVFVVGITADRHHPGSFLEG